MPTSTKPRALSRVDIRRRQDRATRSVVLEFTGKGLRFHERLYGFADGVFMVVSPDEMPFPPHLRALGKELSVPPEATAVAFDLKSALVDALIAEGMVRAPQMLAEFADPVTVWHPWDLRELERRHVVALARVVELEKLAERDMRLRAVPSLTEISKPANVSLPEPEPEAVEPELSDMMPKSAESAPPERPIDPANMTITKVEAAVVQAREMELPQRFPNGTRRALQKLVRAQYVVRGADTPSVRGSLLEAMQDAESMASKMRKVGGCDVEVTVVDWDGEWPVVVRRYGEGGRTVYRVEDALKRVGEAA